MYDPVLGLMLSPDNYVQDQNTINYNRYAYCSFNPLKYTDPDGQIAQLVVGALAGGMANFLANGAQFNIKGLGYFGVGAVAGTGSAYVGNAIAGAINFSGFAGGALIGGGTGFIGGFLGASGNAWINGAGFDNGISMGLKWGVLGFASGAAIGGISAGINASHKGKNFLTGGELAKVYTSPVKNNPGNKNGECVLRCLEEFSNSYGKSEYDFAYWLKENEYKLGVLPSEVEQLVENEGVFSSEQIFPTIDYVTEAMSNDKRVFMGFNTDKASHAVMVSKVKVWPSGRYRIWFAETSPVRIVPYSSANLFEFSGRGFWTFYPR
jgi:hypothetical protein